MPKYRLSINDEIKELDVDADTPLLWVLRDELQLLGTKFGCGIGQCGACTVHLNGNAVRSCSIPVMAVGEAKVTTIEGLSVSGEHPVQQAWLEHDHDHGYGWWLHLAWRVLPQSCVLYTIPQYTIASEPFNAPYRQTT